MWILSMSDEYFFHIFQKATYSLDFCNLSVFLIIFLFLKWFIGTANYLVLYNFAEDLMKVFRDIEQNSSNFRSVFV